MLGCKAMRREVLRWTKSSISAGPSSVSHGFPSFSVPRNKQQSGGALIAKREEWIGASSQDKTPEGNEKSRVG